MVTRGAEVIVGALSTLPADANDGLLTAGVTHGAIMLNTFKKRHQLYSHKTGSQSTI